MDSGYKETVLLQLPYFDTIRMHVIDPLHNLFLGTAKHVFRMWVDRNILINASLKLTDERARSVNIASDSGRLPHGFASNWTSFTGHEWKLWTVVCLMSVLEGVLPEPHISIWQHFVLAWQVICKSPVSTKQLNTACLKFKRFGTFVAQEYGKEAITPNMHMQDCLLDYGTVYVI